mgnify:CR=1 FL=1
MRVIFFKFLFFFFLVSHPITSVAENRFLSVIDDVPLLSGLEERELSASVFDSSRGRITEVEAYGPVTLGSIGEFYSNILPRFGWNLISKKNRSLASGPNASWSWGRGSEKLVIEVINIGENIEVSFLHTFPNEQRH